MRIVINDNDYQSFTTYTLELNYSKIASVFSFSGLPETLPNPLSFPNVEIFRTNEEDGSEELLLTGEILAHSGTVSSQPHLIPVNGSSSPGILENADMPLNKLQFDNLTLKEVTDELLSQYNLEYEVTENVLTEFNKKFIKTTAEPTDTVKGFLNSLASQRNIILSHTDTGKLLFTRINIENLTPAYTFTEGESGIIKMSVNISAQAMHSVIIVSRQASSTSPDGAVSVIQNPYISKFKPKNKILDSGDIFDIDQAARMELNAELSNIKITIETLVFVRPGKLIYVSSPTLKIADYSVFLVEKCTVNGSVNSETYKLDCVLADAYSDSSEIINIFDV